MFVRDMLCVMDFKTSNFALNVLVQRLIGWERKLFQDFGGFSSKNIDKVVNVQ